MTWRSGVGSKTSSTALQICTATSSLGARVGLRRVLVVDGRVVLQPCLGRLAHVRSGDGDVDDALHVGAEHDLALHDARRVVEVHDGLLRAVDRLVRAVDEVLARLGQDLDRDVVGDRALVDQRPDEVEVGLRGTGEPDLDLLVAHPDEQVEHRPLAFGVHRVDECLVAVTQVDGAPAGRTVDLLRGPGAVGQVDGDLLGEGDVLVDRHPGGALRVLHRFAFVGVVAVRPRRTPRRGGPVVRPRRGDEGGGVPSTSGSR